MSILGRYLPLGTVSDVVSIIDSFDKMVINDAKNIIEASLEDTMDYRIRELGRIVKSITARRGV